MDQNTIKYNNRWYEDELGPQSIVAIDPTFHGLFPDESNKIRNHVCHSSNIVSGNQFINIIISNIVEKDKIKIK